MTTSYSVIIAVISIKVYWEYISKTKSLQIYWLYFPRSLAWLVMVVVVSMLYMTLSEPVSEMELSFREDSNIGRDFDLVGSSLISTFIEIEIFIIKTLTETWCFWPGRWPPPACRVSPCSGESVPRTPPVCRSPGRAGQTLWMLSHL